LTAPQRTSQAKAWPAESAEALYRLPQWGSGYFGVSARGTVEVYPDGDRSRPIDLLEVVEGLEAREIAPPVVVRFPGILEHRMRHLKRVFDDAIESTGYTGRYSCLYPIKVNQQRHICEEIRKVGAEIGFGLEVGSKPELVAGLALTAGLNGMPLVCNGFKDDEFIETVILAAKMGRNAIPVVEQLHELELIAKHAAAHAVTPTIGIRAKLASSGVGRWADSGGHRGKFGLSVSEILRAVDLLRDHELLDGLRMLHCHIGSQVYDIRTIKYAVSELAHMYVELLGRGAPMGLLDFGGGLGIDYDGTQSSTDSSVNYTLEQYAADVVYRIKSICDEAGVPHPDLLSESGRALVAHSGVLVFEVLGSRTFPETPDRGLVEAALAAPEVSQPLLDMKDAYERVDEAEPIEVFQDAAHALEEEMTLFNLGYVDMVSRAATEELYWAVGNGLLRRLGADLPDELDDLPDHLCDLYFCNFSLFQSLLDAWGIDQVFPVMPIHRLDEEPTRLGFLADITCDSDGRLQRFGDAGGPKPTLELHPLLPGPGKAGKAPYYLGVFLSSAYQETLGDLHNLLGDTHAVHVSLGDDGKWRIDEVVEGDTVREVLAYVQFDADELRRTIRRDVEAALEAGRLELAEAVSLRRFLDQSFEGYTYLE
jgi:arginine decarboxylase